MTITNTPTRIYLVYGIDDHECTEIDHNECVDVPWSTNREYPSDVEYIRADAVKDAHPKCGTCGYVREFKDCGETLWYECENRQSAYWADHVNPLTDYCPHHSELSK